MVIVAVLALVGALLGGGLVLVADGLGLLPLSLRPPRLADNGGSESARWCNRRSPKARRQHRLDLAIAGTCGLVALIVTRWPMALPLAVLAVLGIRGVAGAATKTNIERLEAIAAWTEMLRDTLAGAAGLTQALVATAPIAPRPLRSQLTALTARLNAGVAIVPALAQLGDEVDDPALDTVIACLVMAATERAQRLSDLLGALAASTRDEVSMRLGVEASRASSRTAVRMITGFSFALLALMAVFARAYLSPYDTAEGQLVLAIVGSLYGLGLWLMTIMVRPEPATRLLVGDAMAS
jgi:Flp pilus assembly protein TadB